LEEIKIDRKVLKATKSLKEKIRPENLIENGELTPNAKKVFTDIYHSFAV
jgi:hypothetical protein